LPLEDAVATAQDSTAPFTPLIAAVASAVEQSDVGQAVKEEIDKFFDVMPVFMDALDAVAELHPFINGMLNP
jgi:hypothetical protein